MNKWAREDGQGLVEYALILVLIAVVVIIILTILGGSVAMVYARVIAGLNGQVIAGVGEEFVVANFDHTSTQGGGNCSATFTNLTIIALQDGRANGSATVSVPVSVNGVTAGSIPATTSGSGIASVAGPHTYSASCPLTVNMGGRTMTFN